MKGDNKTYWTWIKNQRLADIVLEEARDGDYNLIKSLKQQLAEAEARRKKNKKDESSRPKEIDGPQGPEPTRYGDWEKKGITSDF